MYEYTYGKIDFFGTGRKINKVTVSVKFQDGEHPTFSAIGYIWNANGTDVVYGGQILDTIIKYIPNNVLFTKIYHWWEKYQLNDSQAGSPAQEIEVKKYLAETGKSYNFQDVIKHLQAIGLYKDKGYRYGSSWLYNPIEEEDLVKMRRLLSVIQRITRRRFVSITE